MRKIQWIGAPIALAIAALGLAASCGSAPEPIAIADASSAADGSWRGEYFWFPNKVVVEVKVEGGRIAAIAILEHFQGQGKAAEAIVDRVVAAQSLKVDAIAGATHSSVTILKAIEDALKKAGAR